jgi:hypothetical protein
MNRRQIDRLIDASAAGLLGVILALAGCAGPRVDTPLPPGVTSKQAAACRLAAETAPGGSDIVTHSVTGTLLLNSAINGSRAQRIYEDCLEVVKP